MKILVTQTLFLGDLVLTIPLLDRLRDAYPDSGAHIMVRKGLETIVQSHPSVSSVITFDRNGEHKGWRGVTRLARQFRAAEFDLALVLPGSARTALAVYLSGVPRRIGSNLSSGLLLFEGMVKFPRELKNSPHAQPGLFIDKLWRAVSGQGSFVSPLFTDIVHFKLDHSAPQRYLQLLEPLGIRVQEKLRVPRLVPTRRDYERVKAVLGSALAGSVVAMAPGSLWNTKRWPASRYRAVARSLAEEGHTVILVGGKTDVEICREIVGGESQQGIISVCGELTPLESAEVIRRCRLLVSNDSAPMHLALAVGTPCVAIFGPTVPQFGFVPFPDRTTVVELKSLPCRPCTPHGGARCPIGTHECMTRVTVDSVLGVVRGCLKKQEQDGEP